LGRCSRDGTRPKRRGPGSRGIPLGCELRPLAAVPLPATRQCLACGPPEIVGPAWSAASTKSIRSCAVLASGWASWGSSPRRRSSARSRDPTGRREGPLKIPGRSPSLFDDSSPDPFPYYGPQ